ncbi:hypothetical protein [Hoeflea sp.]|uniref:hypothetical protein n=1 Tax=Hoeflea sp. TaxID=1940281 RepID=UPI0025C1E68D|nr:hypothetical protein [Hoeflea sp.]
MTDELMRKVEAIDGKVDRLEKDVQDMKITQAVRDVQFKTIADGLKELKAGINRVLWVLGLALIGAIAQFVLRGGLTIGGG